MYVSAICSRLSRRRSTPARRAMWRFSFGVRSVCSPSVPGPCGHLTRSIRPGAPASASGGVDPPRPRRGGAAGDRELSVLLVAVADPSAGEVVVRQLHDHAVLRQDADVVLPHLAADVGEDLMPVLELDAEHCVRQRLDHTALDLDGSVFLCHAGYGPPRFPGSRLPVFRCTGGHTDVSEYVPGGAIANRGSRVAGVARRDTVEPLLQPPQGGGELLDRTEEVLGGQARLPRDRGPLPAVP